jgi:hypothetical protein
MKNGVYIKLTAYWLDRFMRYMMLANKPYCDTLIFKQNEMQQ